jgi:hypothetical protein
MEPGSYYCRSIGKLPKSWQGNFSTKQLICRKKAHKTQDMDDRRSEKSATRQQALFYKGFVELFGWQHSGNGWQHKWQQSGNM